jgi:hypothetical protein
MSTRTNWKRRMRRRKLRRRGIMRKVTMTFEEIAGLAGYRPEPGGKLNLPATQEAADKLAAAASSGFAAWKPGDDLCEVVLTGAGPVWGYLCIAHALHGRVVKLTYAAPNATIEVWAHGV